MKRLVIFIFMLCISIKALTLHDIYRLSASGIKEKLIIGIIASSKKLPTLSPEQLINMKNRGISENIIGALIKNGAQIVTKRHKRKRSSFDQFFLSPYYSHQYGWPQPNYDNPGEILRQGLLYRPPTRYPHASRRRVRGWMYSRSRKWPWGYTISPYSMIIRKDKPVYYSSQDLTWLENLLRKNLQTQKKKSPSPVTKKEKLPILAKKAKLSEKNLRQLKVIKEKPKVYSRKANATKNIAIAPKLLGNWYESLTNVSHSLNKLLQGPLPADVNVSFYVIDIQGYHNKIISYNRLLLRLRERILTLQKKGKNINQWLKIRLPKSAYLDEKNALHTLKKLANGQKIYLPVEDEILSLITYYQDCNKDVQRGILREQLIKKIVASLQIIHHKFKDVLHRLDVLLFEYELE